MLVSQVASVRMSMTDRKSTRLNSSHLYISYAVFCLKQKRFVEDTAETQCCPTVPPFSPTAIVGYRSRPPMFPFVCFFLMIRRPPRSTPFPTRRSSDLGGATDRQVAGAELGAALLVGAAASRSL